MKRFAVCLLVVMFLLAGCAMNLTSLKPDQDLDTQLSILMARVEKCEPNIEGWRILEIPCKDPSDEITFMAYKHSERGSFGVVLGNQILGYDSIQETWFFSSLISRPIDEGTAKELLAAWFEMLFERADLTQARIYKEKVPGTEI